MATYRNVFFDKRVNNVVEIDLSLDEVIIQEEEEDGSQEEEFNIKYGYKYKHGESTQAFVGAPLIYETRFRREGNVAMQIAGDAELIDGHRSVSGAFSRMVLNYILTCPKDEGLSRGAMKRFWYNLSGGTVHEFKESYKGLHITHFLLGRDGGRITNIEGHSLLPNIYGGGDTCHGALNEAKRWRDSQGKSEGDPESLGKSFELFKTSAGNNDLASSNLSARIPNSHMIEILEEFKQNYVLKLEGDVMRERMEEYVDSFIVGIQERSPEEGNKYNINNLAIILENTPNYYIEDYLY